jgi:hypothetical protein
MTTPALAETVKGKGRHYRHPVTGDLVPSVTNILSVINKPALMGWAARQVAVMAADMKDLLPDMKHDEVVDLLKGAASRSSSRAGQRGTDIHSWLADELSGVATYELAEPASRYLPAVRSWLDATNPAPVTIETTMFHPLYAGTADAVVEIDGAKWLLDFKTSRAIYDEAALQTCALAGCFLWVENDKVVEARPVDHIGVVRFDDKGKWELREVRNPTEHHDMFLSLVSLWYWQHDTDKWEAK